MTVTFTWADGSTCTTNSWTVSGCVATAPTGDQCTGGLGGSYTVDSASITVSGNTATFERVYTASADAGPGTTYASGGSCTKQ